LSITNFVAWHAKGYKAQWRSTEWTKVQSLKLKFRNVSLYSKQKFTEKKIYLQHECFNSGIKSLLVIIFERKHCNRRELYFTRLSRSSWPR